MELAADHAAGKRADRDRGGRRAVDGRAGFGDGLAGKPGHDREADDIGRLALVGRHAERRIALEVLDGAEVFLMRQPHVLHGDIVLEVDPGAALADPDVPERADRNRRILGARHLGGPCLESEFGKRGTRGLRAACKRGMCRQMPRRRPCRREAGRTVRSRHEGGDPGIPDRAAAVMRGQCDIRVPAAGDTERVAVDRLVGAVGAAHRDRPEAQAALRADDARAGHVRHVIDRPPLLPAVDQRGDLDALRLEIDSGADAVVIIGEDGDAAAGRDGEAVGVGADGTGEHDARTVVVVERDRPFDRPGTKDGPPGVDPPEHLPRCALPAAPADDRRHARARRRCRGRRRRGRWCGSSGAHSADRPVRRRRTPPRRWPAMSPTSIVSALSRPPGRKSSSATITRAPARPAVSAAIRPGRPGADDEQIAVQEALVVDVRIRLRRKPPEAGRAPYERLVEPLPEGCRPHEGLVVEAGREERRQQVVDRQRVEGERRPAVLARRLETVVELGDGRARVRLPARAGAQFDQRVRLLRAGGKHAARAVILEAPAHQRGRRSPAVRRPACRRRGPGSGCRRR